MGQPTNGEAKDPVTNRLQGEIAYHDIDVAFFEPTAQMRAVLRNALLAVGYRRLLDCHSVDDVMRRLRNDTIDLLIVDSDSDADGIYRVVRQIREGRLGYDPFLAIMALTSNAVPTTIKGVLDVGCDDLITRPTSPKVIAERTANLVHNRKPFVVTPNYAGPERHGQDGTNDDLPKFDAPNALRQKALGGTDIAVDITALNTAREVFVKCRIAKMAAAIGDEALKIKSQLSGGPDIEIQTNQCTRLFDMITKVSELITKESLVELEPLGQSMAKIARSISASPMLNERMIAVLHLHGEAIAATVNDREEATVLTATVLNHTDSGAAE